MFKGRVKFVLFYTFPSNVKKVQMVVIGKMVVGKYSYWDTDYMCCLAIKNAGEFIGTKIVDQAVETPKM